MAITSIRLQNFRSYADASFELGGAVNIIVGPNASGKTNLLEGVMVSALGASYRARDAELVAHGQPWARLDAQTESGLRTVKIENQTDSSTKKSYVIDNQPLQKLPLQRTLPVVLFEPNHLALLHGSPERRRDYLDDLLEQTEAGFGRLRKNYRRALFQRNALLKHGQPAKDQLFVWNLRLSELGNQVAMHRQKLVKSIAIQLPATYQSLANNSTNVTVSYKSSCAGDQYGSKLLRQLESNQAEDLRRGFTAHGPHRDDMVFMFDNYDADSTASRGEARTLLLALKIMELGLLEKTRGSKPLLLLDDVFSELDGARRRALTEAIQGYQTFITTTDADVVIQHFIDNCTIIPMAEL